ncbi:nucleotidyl transferase AbiEii/AbiGii toxin family protein [Blautia producta]|uniref:nucleotidyl transferase AbiEii/AbiGii toxin family protein n=2 Tax=Blautia producta TaxID=33035 RepID=UPI001D016671|nr:nucleotidyl transferase AbiEii/AbiGii toxin family protein [Blautia producta]MCB5874961.1 nucleotidyl transferase AbiEii/AbiGii toxin family protein [Blautia producta]
MQRIPPPSTGFVMLERNEVKVSRCVLRGGNWSNPISLLDTLRHLPLTEEQISFALNSICAIDLADDVSFEIKSVVGIRKDDVYGGYSVRLDAIYDTIVTPLSIDVSTGDVITPSAVKYEFGGIFDENVKITLWGYNIETVMAEKVETILRRGIFTTRPRDYYDVYILATTQKYDMEIFEEALKATAVHRGSMEKIADVIGIIEQIASNVDLKNMWEKYRKRFPYAKEISFEDIVDVLRKIITYGL